MAGEKEGSLYREFERVIAELEKTVICTETVPEAGNALRVRFQNPSAKDFIHQYISRNFAQYRDMLLRGSCYFECCSSLLELSIKADNDMEYYRRVMERAVSLEEGVFLNTSGSTILIMNCCRGTGRFGESLSGIGLRRSSESCWMM